jgi:hypothetical protein
MPRLIRVLHGNATSQQDMPAFDGGGTPIDRFGHLAAVHLHLLNHVCHEKSDTISENFLEPATFNAARFQPG